MGEEEVSPSIEQAQQYLKTWDRRPIVYMADEALNRLFLETYPENKDVLEVTVKVCALNSLYSTRIRNMDILSVAQHIVSLDIDSRLAKDDLTLITDITFVGNGVNRCYSFATKYCSFHRPNAYSIYDGIVDATLWYYKKRDKFMFFQRQDMLDYVKFMNTVDRFCDYYGLGALSRKALDKYLWLLGQDLGIYKTS